MSDDLTKQIELAIAGLNKKYKSDNTVMRLDSKDFAPWPSISTGALTLDLALGIGGLPEGRIVEIYGPESSGKSSLAMMVVAGAQARGGTCAYIDAEHAVDPIYAGVLGVNMDELYICQPDYGEQGLDVLDTLISTGGFKVIVVDSVPALVPLKELEGDIGDSHVGLQARLMGQTMRKITAKAHNSGTMVIFINQIREKIGVMFGSPETTPGGRALPFYASVRIDIRRKETIKVDGMPDANRVKATIKKNKMAPPYRTAEFDILFGRGIDKYGCIADLAVEMGYIDRAGAWYTVLGERVQGRPNVIEHLAAYPKEADELATKIRENYK